MADLNKIQRSRDRISEIQNYLMTKREHDESIHSHLNALEQSIKIIDLKIEELKVKAAVNS